MFGISGNFDAPTPGQGLTQAPGASRVQQPPKFVHLDEALEFTWARFHKKKPLVKLVALLKGGVPAETVCRTVLYQGLLQGYWTVTLALLMFQTVLWQIEAIAKIKGIKTKTFSDDKGYNSFMLQLDSMLVQKEKQESDLSSLSLSNAGAEPSASKFKGFF